MRNAGVEAHTSRHTGGMKNSYEYYKRSNHMRGGRIILKRILKVRKCGLNSPVKRVQWRIMNTIIKLNFWDP
jgi:hypothetical protein